MPMPRVCVCSLSYTVRNAHASYCRLWPIWLYNVFPHFLLKVVIFKKKKRIYKRYNVCFDFLTTLTWNISLSKNSGRYDQKCLLVFMLVTRFLCQVWMRVAFSRQIRKVLKYQISRKSIPWESVRSCSMWTDGQTDKTTLIVAFCNFSKRP